MEIEAAARGIQIVHLILFIKEIGGVQSEEHALVCEVSGIKSYKFTTIINEVIEAFTSL
jgi:hypothetical protein